jgi:CelD/BcsL family acetyltransferase involved in cellulose biosynthesis
MFLEDFRGTTVSTPSFLHEPQRNREAMSITEKPSGFAPDSNALTRHVVNTLVGMEEIETDWRTLEVICGDAMAYFQTFDWCRNWIATVADEAGVMEPRIIAIRLGSKPVAIVPLMLSRGPAGVRVLSNLGEPHSQYAGMLSDPVLYSGDAAALIREYLVSPPGCDLVNLDMVPSSSRLEELVEKNWQVEGYENESSALDLTQFENSNTYLDSFEGKKKRNRVKRRKRMEKDYGPIELKELWQGDPDFERIVRRCVEMKKVWLSETGRVSTGFALPSYADFLVELGGDRDTREGFVALVLMAGEREVAIEVSMIRNRHMYAYIGGFDWELRSFSPGKVQMEATVCWGIDSKIKAYDLLGNTAGYKESWSNITCPLHAYTHAYTLRGRLYADVWLRKIRPALKHTFNSLPAGVRKAISAAQASSAQ